MDRQRPEYDRRRRHVVVTKPKYNPVEVGIGVGVALFAAIPIAAIAAEAFVSRTPLGRVVKAVKPIVMWPKKKLHR